MKSHVLLIAAGLSLPLSPLLAPAQETPPAAPSADAAALRVRIDELERENKTLRMQWGQVTMELDRLRKENDRLKKGSNAAAPAAAVAAGEPAPAATAAVPVKIEPAPRGDAALRAELDRLRRENEDLRAEKEELTELAGVTAEGETVASLDARITTEFDERENKTVVRTEPRPVRMRAGSAADHYLSLVYAFPGRELTDASAANVTGFVQARHSGGVHSGDKSIAFVLDGETVEVPITDYRVEHRQTGVAGKRRINKDDETVAFALDAESLRRIARGVRGEARIGNVRFELSREDLAMFKAVQRRIEKGI